jgi:uncharacterized MnhB-related membrane protein
VSELLTVALVIAALAGTAVVATRDVTSQAIVLAVYGLSLGVLALALQAPDVALALLAIGAAITPMLVMLAIASGKKTTPEQER